jgi:hypothetical protein
MSGASKSRTASPGDLMEGCIDASLAELLEWRTALV